jgi:3',5'-nucleoside bisphosphate phosphatase
LSERIDLHLHTTASDGGAAPPELVRLAAAADLHIIAIADHDTAAGVRQVQAQALPIRLIPAIEVSTTLGSSGVHMLGYFIDPQHRELLAYEERARNAREARMSSMIAKLAALGVSVTIEEVRAVAGAEGVLGRPHLARVLTTRGYVSSPGEAFNKYLSDSGPAFAPTELMTPRDAIELIHAAGGLAVWAHPSQDVYEREIKAFVGWGLDGVECYRPRMLPIDVQLLEGYADLYRLVVTGGSDWHGPWGARLGEFAVTRREVGRFLEKGGI